MTREEIIQGLQFTIDMFLFNPNTGETFTEPRNDMDKTTIDACREAIKVLKDNSYELWKESYEVEHSRNIRLKEQIQFLEQGSVLDKIRAEIADTLYVDSLIFGELIDFKNGKISSDDVIEEFNRITRMEVLRIIDKYTAESEEA